MPPVLEFNVFIVLLFVALGLGGWFLVSREIGSARRMKCMMDELGLEYDPAAVTDPNVATIIKTARAKCLRCRSEGLCERWLAQEAGSGVNAEDFCPNAGTFKALAREDARGIVALPDPTDAEPRRMRMH